MSAIFISYRREDSEDAARALYESLVALFGRDRLFMDVEAISLGSDFRQAIDHSLSNCGVFLAVIGPDWLNAKVPGDATGQRRLDNPNDFVRQEIATALKKGSDLPVIPVLVRSARMPSADQLPDDLKELPYRNALTLTHVDWDGSINRLVAAIRPHVGEPVPSSPEPQLRHGAGHPGAVAARRTKSRTGIFAVLTVVVLALIGGLYLILHGAGGTSQIRCTLVRNPNLNNLPAPVDVFVDDRQIGQIQSQNSGSTPLDFQAAAGEHRFRFADQQRHSNCSGTFSVNANQTRFIPRIRAGGTECALDAVMR